MKQSLVPNGVSQQYDLQRRIDASLRSRLGADYNQAEIEKVSSYDKQLFPENFELDFETSEHFRRLAIFSQVELKPLSSISSHRRFVGSLIVALKKISWPFISAHLAPTFLGLQEMNGNLIYMLAKHEVELRELRKSRA